MEKDLIFFGEGGLTATSANYVANMAKEYYLSKEKALENASFVSQDAEFLDSQRKKTIMVGVDSQFLANYQDQLLQIAETKSLIAWLREAIKAKQQILHEIRTMSTEDLAKELGLEVPKKPEYRKLLTDDDVVATWNVKERNRYYYLETLCVTLGEAIHPDGEFAKSRKVYFEKISHPVSISNMGRDSVVYTFHPSVAKEEVDDTFFQLQAAYRSYQAELNAMKHSVEEVKEEDVRKADEQFNVEMSKYEVEIEKLEAKTQELKHKKLVKASRLKIIIPNSLQPIYEKIQHLGKKS